MSLIDPEEQRAFERLYGPWAPLRPGEVAGFLEGFEAPWWIAGGWAIEAFTAVQREHEDIDVSVFRRDVPLLRGTLEGRFHLWSAGSGALRPLNEQWPEMRPDSDQIWVREHSLAPWVVDFVVNPDEDGAWVNRRWAEHVAPLAEVTWVADDGIRYLRPEIVLLFKARLRRPKDDHDLRSALPLLSVEQVAWLRTAVAATEPGHAWLELL